MSPPSSAIEEAFESDTEIRIFSEGLNITLSTNVNLTITAPGTYVSAPGTTGILAAGTQVAVYLIHMDIVDVTDGGIGVLVDLSGSVTFGADILGIIAIDAHLDAADALLGSVTTSYPTGVSLRGIWESQDSLTLSADRRTLTLNNLRVFDDGVDQIRVLVAVPEPGSATLMAFGLILLAARRSDRL